MSDPTGTAALRRSFNAEASRRLSRLRSMTHAVLVERDLMAARNDPIATMLGQPGHRLAAFAQWFERVANEQLGGPWPAKYIERAHTSGRRAAGVLVGGAPASQGRAPNVYQELAQREFGGIAAAMIQQVTRQAASAAIGGQKPALMYRSVLAVLRKVGQARLKTAVDTIVVAVHNAARLAHFEQVGITRVGLVPEMLEPPRPSRFGMRRIVKHDHVHVHDTTAAEAQQRVDEAQQRLTEAELAEAQAKADVEVATARVETAQVEAERTLALAQTAEAAAESAPEQFRANAELQSARANIKASNAAVKEAEMRTALESAQEKASAAFQAAEQARQELAEAQLELAQATEPDVFSIATALDEKVCKICLAASEDSYTLDEARGLLPLHPRCRCLLPGTVVEGKVLAVSKAWYAGPIVDVVTKSGKRLSLTANHPVLTPHGLIAAGSLREGSDLFCDSREIDVGPRDNMDNGPSCIENIFIAFTHFGVFKVNAATVNLHHDQSFLHGDVDIVSADPRLLINIAEGLAEDGCEFVFVPADATSRKFMGGPSLSRPGGFAHLRPAQPDCVAIVAPSDAVELQYAVDQLAGDAELILDGVDRGAIFVETHNTLFRQFGRHLSIQAVRSVMRSKQSAYHLVSHTELVSQSPTRDAGSMLLDEITHIDRRIFRGHVYDLQTTSGYMLAGGLAIKNCAWVPSLPQSN